MVSLRYLPSFLELAEFGEEVLALGDGARLVHLRPADLPLGIDEERRALVHAALFVEHAVGFADRAVRPVVRQQGKGNAAEVLGPGLEARDGICADLQDLDVQLLEFFEVRTEPADLILSAAGECEGQE